MTGLDYARLALLRSLSLQHETRRAVRTRQREAAALLARTSMETCILGLWCLHNPDAATKLRMSKIKTAPAMLSFLSSTGLIPDTVIRQAVRELGKPEMLPDVRSMTAQINAKTGATLAIHLNDQAYRPASQYFTHATSSALLRHVTTERRRTTRPKYHNGHEDALDPARNARPEPKKSSHLYWTPRDSTRNLSTLRRRSHRPTLTLALW